MTTVTAAVVREQRAPLTLEQLELDEIRDDEVRVRMVATGICHTDAVVRDGLAPTPLPAVLGHEGTGVVEEVGRSITTASSPGDHVVLAAAYCGTCKQCRAGLDGLLRERASPRTSVVAGTTGPPPLDSGRNADLLALLRAVVLLDLRQRRRDQHRAGRPLGAAGGARTAGLRDQHRRRLRAQRAPAPGRVVVRGHRRRGRRPRRGHGRPGGRLHDDRRGGPARLPSGAGARARCHPHHQLLGRRTWPPSCRAITGGRGRQLRPRHHRRARCGDRRGRCALHPGDSGGRGRSSARYESRHRHRHPFPAQGVDVQDDRPGQLGSAGVHPADWWSCGSRGASPSTSSSRPTSSTTSTPRSTTRSPAQRSSRWSFSSDPTCRPAAQISSGDRVIVSSRVRSRLASCTRVCTPSFE